VAWKFLYFGLFLIAGYENAEKTQQAELRVSGMDLGHEGFYFGSGI